jgi:hypothetical protein
LLVKFDFFIPSDPARELFDEMHVDPFLQMKQLPAKRCTLYGDRLLLEEKRGQGH